MLMAVLVTVDRGGVSEVLVMQAVVLRTMMMS